MEKKFKENREGYEEPQNKGVAEGDEVDWLGGGTAAPRGDGSLTAA